MELETVAIVSPKNPAQMWLINKEDYDPAQHEMWTDAAAAQTPAAPAAVMADEAGPLDFDPIEPMAPGHDEPVGDFVTDGTGAVAKISIVDPDDARKRKAIPAEDYDPDNHTLWSERKR